MLKINKEKCTGCEICIEKCPFGSLSMKDGFPIVDDTCVLCGQCVEACPCDALSIEESSNEKRDLSDYSDVWVVAELNPISNKLQKVTLELISEGKIIANRLKQKVRVLLLCKEIPENFIQQVSEVGCDYAMIMKDELLGEYNTEVFADTISKICNEYKPSILFMAASETGRDLAPRVSAMLQTGLTADCTGFDVDNNDNLIQIRPTYGGNIMASIISPNHRPQMASVRPNVFTINEINNSTEIIVEELNIELNPSKKRTWITKIEENLTSYKDVAESEIVIIAGYGVGSKENYKKIEKLAVKMGAAIGATRKVVDEGWAPFEIQVGQTGKTIAPNLYISFGVSGALQHTIGIRNAKHVIAVNSDPAAPIFSMCDEAILGDCISVAEEMEKML